MKIIIDIPEYNKEVGYKFNWVNGFEIRCKIENDTVILSGNKEGLESLANHFLNLAQEMVPTGYHIHLDNYNSLEEDSNELIIEKL